MSFLKRVIYRLSLAQILAGTSTRRRLWSPADVVAAIAAHGSSGGGGGSKTYGNGQISSAESGSETLTQTVVIPAGTIEVGSSIEIVWGGYGQPLYDPVTESTTNPKLVLDVNGETWWEEQYAVPTAARKAGYRWMGLAVGEGTLEGQWVGNPLGTIPATLGADFDGDITIIASIEGGGSGIRGVRRPTVIIHPPGS